MRNNKLNTLGGFTTAASAPQKCDTPPNKYYVIIALSAGAERGDRHGPLCHRTSALYPLYLPVSDNYLQHFCTGYRCKYENDNRLVHQIDDE